MTSGLRYWTVLALALSACGGGKDPAPTGSVRVVISGNAVNTGTTSQALVTPPPDGFSLVKSVVLTITGPNGVVRTDTFTTNLGAIEKVYPGLLVDPVSGTASYVFNATAFSAANVALFASGDVPLVITRNITTAVNLILQQILVVIPGTVNVTAPVITSIAISDATPNAGQAITLIATVKVEDSTNPATYSWFSSCSLPLAGSPADTFNTAAGPFTGALGGTPPSPPPATCDLINDICTVPITLLSYCAGSETVTFSVTDPSSEPGASFTSTAQVTIPYAAALGTADVTIAYNFIPDILSLSTPSNTQPDFGGTIVLTATVNDRNHDGLFYTWLDTTCGGTFTPDSNADALTFPYPAITTTWTAPPAPVGGAQVQCTLVLEVDDNSSDFTNTAHLNIAVGPPAIL